MNNLQKHCDFEEVYSQCQTFQSLFVKMPSYRVPIEDEVFRSMKVDNFSKTPYSDATQVCKLQIIYILTVIMIISINLILIPRCVHEYKLCYKLYELSIRHVGRFSYCGHFFFSLNMQ